MKKSAEFNGYLIPEGEAVYWSLVNGHVSDSLYPKDTKGGNPKMLQWNKASFVIQRLKAPQKRSETNPSP